MSQSGKKDTPNDAADKLGDKEPDMGLADHQRSSASLLYEAAMRGGGEAFGQPFDVGTATLTEKAVGTFKQRSFFGFETLEKNSGGEPGNKFTRHGAAPFRGPYRKPKP